MAAVTGGTIYDDDITTASSDVSDEIRCSSNKIAVTVVTDNEITINGEVSQDATTWITFPLSYRLDSTDVVGQGILVASEWAGMVDCSGFQWFRLNMANASGSTAAVVATAYRRS